MLTKDFLESRAGYFTHITGCKWFLTTDIGNFVWSDPQYNGDNTMTLFNGSYEDYCTQNDLNQNRSKGVHLVNRFCGEEFTLVIPQ